MKQKKNKSYTNEFKELADKLAVESDQPIAQTARDLGVNANTLSKFHGQSAAGAGRQINDQHLYAELKQLRRGRTQSILQADGYVRLERKLRCHACDSYVLYRDKRDDFSPQIASSQRDSWQPLALAELPERIVRSPWLAPQNDRLQLPSTNSPKTQNIPATKMAQILSKMRHFNHFLAKPKFASQTPKPHATQSLPRLWSPSFPVTI